MSEFQHRPSEESRFDLARQIEYLELRKEYVDQACGGDQGLRERVEELLRAYELDHSFVERPPPLPIIDHQNPRHCASSSAAKLIGS